jgi:SAM-dependent methyltransferase
MTGTMNDREYQVMADVEGVHWWYRGLRDLVGRVLVSRGAAARSDLRVLDVGCGTGENLRMLGRTLRTSYLGGFDLSTLALDLARQKVPHADLYQSNLCNPEFHADGYDLVLTCDVLSMTGLEAAREGMVRVIRRMRPDGLLIVNLPAYPWLYSRHDVAIGTRQRFTRRQVRGFLEQNGLKIELVTHRLCALLPMIVLARLPSMLFTRRDPAARSDLSLPRPAVNRLLTQAMTWENRAILRGLRLPWGASIFAVARAC